MRTPQQVSVDSFSAEKALFLATACLEFEDNSISCVRCGACIKWEMVFVSTHSMTEFCVGTGKICQVDIPYCPQCEETPYIRGCFHVRDGQDVAAQLAV
jgi:hypothetical protein